MLEISPSREVHQRPQGDTGADAFTPSYHREMLMDDRRVKAFKKAIDYYGDPKLTFMEFGIGTGVMSAHAATRFGHVYAVERDPFIYSIAKSNLSKLGLLDKQITLIHADVLEADLPQVDVVMAELLSTLMIHEPEVPALNRATRELLKPDGVVIPQTVINTVTPAWSKYAAHDVSFISPYTLFTGVPLPEAVGETKVFYAADFMSGEVANKVSVQTDVLCMLESEINSLVLNSNIQLAPGVTFAGSDSLNPAMVVPIEPVYVTAGQTITIKLEYDHFSDWQSFKASIIS